MNYQMNSINKISKLYAGSNANHCNEIFKVIFPSK